VWIRKLLLEPCIQRRDKLMLVVKKITLRDMHLNTIEEREKGTFCLKQKGVGC